MDPVQVAEQIRGGLPTEEGQAVALAQAVAAGKAAVVAASPRIQMGMIKAAAVAAVPADQHQSQCEMTDESPIVIPLHHGGGMAKNDTELRYALRSLDMHFVGKFFIVIIGEKLPDWIQGVRHIRLSRRFGLKTALKKAAEEFPDGFFWYYDDCCLLRDTNATELKVTPALDDFQTPRTEWAEKVSEIRHRLIAEGYQAADYSRPHGPYWFDKGMIDEAFEDWPGMAGKFPFETWILSKRSWPKRTDVVRQYYGQFNSPPTERHALLNYADTGNTIELRNWLASRFPNPSKFESMNIKTPQVMTKPLPISYVTVCCDRNAHLAASLRSWARHPGVAQMVVVDWASRTPVSEMQEIVKILEANNGRIIRLECDAPFNLGQAINLGMSAATMPLVMKVDADIVLTDHCWLTAAAFRISRNKIDCERFAGSGLYGSFMMRLETIRKIKGHREDLHGWGWEDSDFYQTAASMGVRFRKYAGRELRTIVSHIPHGNESRVARYDGYPDKRSSWAANKNRSRNREIVPRRTYAELAHSGIVTTVAMNGRTHCGPLLAPECWDPIFAPYAGMKANHPSIANGNVGDRLIWEAVMQMYERHNITVSENFEVAIWPGGGNMGPLYGGCIEKRRELFRKAKAKGLPMVVLPQSWSGPDGTVLQGAKVYGREEESRAHQALDGVFPDLALGLSKTVYLPQPSVEEGYFFREDRESVMPGFVQKDDPLNYCICTDDYLSLAAMHFKIHTDRLHFAIAALMVGCRVVLYPNSYHKNRGVYEKSLAALGCEFKHC